MQEPTKSLLKYLGQMLIVAAAGYWIAGRLISIPDLQVFKILNLVGITFDLIGVALLSHFFASNEKYHAFVAGPVAENLMLALVAIPTGMFACSIWGPTGPSRQVLESIVPGAMMLVAMPVFMVLRHFVAKDEDMPLLIPTAIRVNVLGLTFILTGLILQLVGAYKDLHIK